jgi:hypothetical protein
MNHIAIFYHIFQDDNNWEKVFDRQIVALQESGLYDAADYIYIGTQSNKYVEINSTKLKTFNSEIDTLIDLYNFAKNNENYRILYINTYLNNSNIEIESTEYLLKYLEYFNIKNWKSSVELLDQYDCVGTEWITIPNSKISYYFGNFWWSNADYISKLNPEYLLDNNSYYKEKASYWIGTKSPIVYNFYSRNNNITLSEEYKNILTNVSSNNLQAHLLDWPGNFKVLWEMLSYSLVENYGTKVSSSSLITSILYPKKFLVDFKAIANNKLIVYQHEPLVKNHYIDSESLLDNLELGDEIWDYDLENINYLKQRGIVATFRPFLYTRALKRIKNISDPDIDILFFGTLTPYRSKILSDFTRNYNIPFDLYHIFANLNIVIAWNKYGKELDELIGRSKIILNLHPYEGEQRQQQARIFYSLINNKCILSEKSKINYYNDMIVEFSGIKDMQAKVGFLLKDENWKKYTTNNFRAHSRKFLREGDLKLFNIS